MLAEQDFTASAEILAHPDGEIFAAYSNGGQPTAVVAELGQRFELERIALRLWPGGTPLQPTLTAVFDLLAAHRPAFGEIEHVRIEVAPEVYRAHERFAEPEGTFDALLSYPFAVASAIRDGRFWLDSTGPGKVGDPDLRRFMRERIELAATPGLTRESSRVEIALTGGKTLEASADAAKGTPDNPAGPAELRAKFERSVAGRLGEADAADLLDLLAGVDELDDLDRLFELLRAAAHQRTSVQ